MINRTNIFSYNRAAIPGQIMTVAGALACWMLLDWRFALTFVVGGVLGSMRLEPRIDKR